MTIKKTEKGYQVDVRPQGRNGRRFRKTFPTRTEAIAYEKHIVSTWANAEEWQGKTDKRRLSDLVETWFHSHGQHLKSGSGRKKELDKAVRLLGDPLAAKFTAKDFAQFRVQRLEEVSANTVNHDLTNLRALYNELKRLGEWQGPNPLEGIRRIKMDEPELSFLSDSQINELLVELDSREGSHARIQARICLATGARWGESIVNRASRISGGKLHFTATKSGKNRSVPISNELQSLISENLPIIDGMNSFKRAIKALGWNLPKGQQTHILRHTFASHFMINGGNIITLQRILGHGTLAMTVRYAHLAPDHLAEVLDLNPLQRK